MISSKPSDPEGFQNLCTNMMEHGASFEAHIPDRWKQGRTAYGGVTAGLALHAAQKAVRDLPPLISAQIAFIGPVGGNPVFTPPVMRQGKNVTSINVDVHSEDKFSGRMMYFFGASRESVLNEDFPAPEAGTPEETPDFVPPQLRDFVPPFLSKFDVKLIAGHRPASGADEGYVRTWVRHLDPTSRASDASFIALADVLPPAAVPMIKVMKPMSSINWHLNILTPNISTRDGWWHVESRLTAAANGYSSQIMRYWNTDGTLVAEGVQSVAVFA